MYIYLFNSVALEDSFLYRYVVYTHGCIKIILFYFQVRVEQVKSPEDYIPALLERVKPDYIKSTYKVQDWPNAENFLEQIARKSGKLLKVFKKYIW